MFANSKTHSANHVAVMVWVVASLLSFFLISACAPNQQTTDSTFPQTSSACTKAVIPNRYIVHWKDGRRTVEAGGTRQQFIKAFVEPNLKNLELVEPDFKVQLIESPTVQASATTALPNDWGQAAVGATEAASLGATGAGMIVAVLDTGVDIKHPQLGGQIYINPGEIQANSIDDDKNGYVDDVYGYDFFAKSGTIADDEGHGTHVAGIIAADESKGAIKGIAQKTQIMPLDFMTGGEGSIADALLGMDYAAHMGAKIINASWGGRDCSQSLQKEIQKLSQAGVLFVTAAGNEGTRLDDVPFYPANYQFPNQLTVGASTPNNVMAGFSNYSFNFVNIFAPGQAIWSTWPKSSARALDGTSMASPFVAGAAAAVWSTRPSATPAMVRDALLSSVKKGNYAATSRGLLNIPAAVAALKAM